MQQTGPDTFTTEFLDGVTFRTYLSRSRFGIVFEVWASWVKQGDSPDQFVTTQVVVAREQYTWEQVANAQG